MTARTALLLAFLALALGQSAARLHAGLTSARNLLVLEIERERAAAIGRAFERELEAFDEGASGAWVEVDPTQPDLRRSSFRDLPVPYAEAEERSAAAVALRAARRAPPTGVDLVLQDGEMFVVRRTATGVRVMGWSEVVDRVSSVEQAGVTVDLVPGEGLLPVAVPALAERRLLWAASEDLVPPPAALPWTALALIAVAAFLVAADVASGIRARAAESARRTERQELLQRLSHHLRTPAASALSLAGTLRSAALVPGERGQLGALLLDEVQRLATGLDHLLRAARDDGGRDEADRISIDLAKWAQDALPRWSVRTPGLTLHAPEPVVAEVDPGQLEEAIEALLDNASKYGLPPVEVRVTRRGASAEIAVSDGGAGVTPADRARLVRKFERGASGQGFGLGLWVARSVAEAHGGEFAVEGSRFTLAVPLVASR